VRLWLAQGDLGRAGQWANEIRFGETPDARQELELLTLARVRIAQRLYPEAQRVLETMARIPGIEGRLNRQIRRTLLLAVALAGQNRWAQAFRALETCLSLAEPDGHIRAFLDVGDVARALLQAYHQSPAPTHRIYLEKLLQSFPKAAQASPASEPHANQPEQLTARELEVLRLMAEGYSNRQIAEKLVIAEGTVKFYVHNLLEKLEVHSRTQALAKARELNLI
jgi:LuxR family maltose regulon positive regulatory protein